MKVGIMDHKLPHFSIKNLDKSLIITVVIASVAPASAVDKHTGQQFQFLLCHPELVSGSIFNRRLKNAKFQS